MAAWTVILLSTAYVGVLFLIAWWGERRAARGALMQPGSWQAVVAFALTLAIYNTSWSFYGSVGRATASGIDFLPIYIAPTFILLCCQPLLRRIYTIAKANHVSSVADFMALRYGKSQTIATIVTLAALVAVLPYIALQLKAVGASFDVLTGTGAPGTVVWGDTPFAVAVAMAAFSIVFGVRSVKASEHHRGLMLAVAFESLVKLAAFLAVACFIVFGMFDGFGYLLTRAAQTPSMQKLLQVDLANPAWISGTVIAFFAFLCLPQAFHVMIVENDSPQHNRAARWLYPIYLLAFSLFMVPIAVAGLLTFDKTISPDTFMIMLPMQGEATGISLLAFIGGFSAATGMVIVSVIALSTMLCNDVVVPAIMRGGRRSFVLDGDVGARLMVIRRIAVVFVLMLAYIVHRLMDESYPLTLIGLVSFVAIAQLGPAFIGGLYWRRANRAGAAAGIAAGMAVWTYTLLLPSVASDLPFLTEFLTSSPFSPTLFRQHAPFGTGRMDIITHATIWSLGANCCVFVLVSLVKRQNTIDRVQADAFVNYALEGRPAQGRLRAIIRLDDLKALVAGFLGADATAAVFDEYVARRSALTGRAADSGFVDLDAIRFTEQVLSGAIGAASARVVMATALENISMTHAAAKDLLDEASEALRINHGLMRGMLESIPQGLCAYDAKFRITAWNERFIVLLGLPRGFIRTGLPLTKVVEFNQARGEMGGDGLIAFIGQVQAASPALLWPYTYARRRPDGCVIEVIFDRMPEGGYIATFTDVTQRYEAATALLDANERLEARVTERTQALQRAKAEAEQANASKTRFLAAASHDLLQPLHAARLFVEALNSSLGKRAATPDEREALHLRQRQHASSADAALKSTKGLLDGLLDMSSLDTGAFKPKIEELPIARLFPQLELEYSVIAQERGVELRVVGSTAIIATDYALLRRVLQNILSNAIRYTPSGKVLLGCRIADDVLRIEVWDTGIGMPEGELETIFGEFRRLEQAASEERGIGLGLSIVERICLLLGHRIEVRSQLGKGSVFTISTPLTGRMCEMARRDVLVPELNAARALLVLCIDDEDVILRGTQALLQEWGHDCVTASDAPSALRRLGGRVPDALVVDYYLGAELTGIQVKRALQDSWGHAVPTALMTAKRDERVMLEARHNQCEMLPKPLKPAVFRRWLASCARGWASSDGPARAQPQNIRATPRLLQLDRTT